MLGICPHAGGGVIQDPPDVGPLARFEALKLNAAAPDEIFHRLCNGDTLRAIADAWGLPKGMFVRWFMDTHKQLFDDAERVRAQDLKAEALEHADSATPEDASAAKLRVDVRLKLLEKMDRDRYGRHTQHTHTVTVDLGERLRRARERVLNGAGRVLLPDATGDSGDTAREPSEAHPALRSDSLPAPLREAELA